MEPLEEDVVAEDADSALARGSRFWDEGRADRLGQVLEVGHHAAVAGAAQKRVVAQEAGDLLDDLGPGTDFEGLGLQPVGLEGGDDGQAVAGHDDVLDEILQGRAHARREFGDLEEKIERAVRPRGESPDLVAPLDGPLPDQVDGVEGDGPAVLEDLEIADLQVVDEGSRAEDADRDFDVDDARLHGDLLGPSREAKAAARRNAAPFLISGSPRPSSSGACPAPASRVRRRRPTRSTRAWSR